jgi:hypothetical protein
MPDISTADQTRITNFMCPLGNEFAIGSRIAYLTTAGALSSATLTAPTITSGTIVDAVFTSVNILSLGGQAAQSASGTTAHAALTAMTAGTYILTPNAALTSGMFHLTSAASSGACVRLINVATASTAVINMGCTENTAEGSYISSSTAYFNFTLRANAAVDIMAVSATRWVIVGATVGVQAFGATT